MNNTVAEPKDNHCSSREHILYRSHWKYTEHKIHINYRSSSLWHSDIQTSQATVSRNMWAFILFLLYKNKKKHKHHITTYTKPCRRSCSDVTHLQYMLHKRNEVNINTCMKTITSTTGWKKQCQTKLCAGWYMDQWKFTWGSDQNKVQRE